VTAEAERCEEGHPDGLRPLPFGAWLAALTLAGLGLRVAVLLVEHLGQERGFNDSHYYSQQAIDLADGILFRDPTTGGPGAEHGPLTSVLLAPFSWMSDPLRFQQLGSVLIGTATIVVIGLIARRIAGDRAGLLASGIAAIYPNLWMNDGLVMSEGPGGLLVALWLLAGLRWHRAPSAAAAALWGVIGGLATLTRSELGLLVVLAALVILRNGTHLRWRTAGLLVLGATLVAGPWMVWNTTRFERPVALTTNDGTTIRGANCDETYYGDAIGSWAVSCLVLDGGATVRTEPSVRSATWRREGLEYARENVTRVPVVVAARAGRLLDLYALGHQVDEDVRDDRPRWASWLGIVAWWALAPLAALGLVRTPGVARALLLSPAAVVVVTGLLFYGGHRIRSPVEPAVCVGAALAIAAWRPRR
jgi:4-amino-4-deoxy-L-arabinose transferase-like glycosyltransferase